MASVKGNESDLAGRKPTGKLGGMSYVLAIATDLGYSRFRPPPSQDDLHSGYDLIRLLRDLTRVQRKVAELHVELQGRKEDMKVAHLTHVSEMEKKIETLARITSILKGFIQNKDRVISRLQQPFPLEYIPIEAEYQKDFSELLQSAASDYGTLAASVSDIHWTHNFREPPSVWRDMLRPIHVALVSCSRYFEAMSAMRESFTTLQKLRVHVPIDSPNKYHSQLPSPTGSNCVTPHSSGNVSPRVQEGENQEGEDETDIDVDETNDRRLSWHSDMDNGL